MPVPVRRPRLLRATESRFAFWWASHTMQFFLAERPDTGILSRVWVQPA